MRRNKQTCHQYKKLEAIQLGADEYIAYPPTVEEVVASGKALIRRYTVLNHQGEKPLTIITYHDLFMCVEYRKLFLKGKEIELTREEFDFLHLLLSSIGRVYTHEQIYRHVWADEQIMFLRIMLCGVWFQELEKSSDLLRMRLNTSKLCGM
jgi:DNA-binding response OmpR family regulator